MLDIGGNRQAVEEALRQGRSRRLLFFQKGEKRRNESATAGRPFSGKLSSHSNYNDEPDPAVLATVEKLIDTSKVIELERIDPDDLPKKYGYRFIKRAFDIASCSVALIVCAIPMTAIAIAVKMDSPGPAFYHQERLGWSIIGQKSGVASIYTFRTALSALEAPSARDNRLRLGVVA